MPPKKQTHKIQPKSPKYTIYKYTVVQIEDEDLDEEEKLFECISDRWFVDENRSECFWPPTTGKSFKLRAINCDKPEDSWRIYSCKIISDGHLTYNIGFKIVREKCNQKYNTSSADERINAATYRRQHPVLGMENDDCSIEHLFAKHDPTSDKVSQNKHHKNVKVSSKKSSENISTETINSLLSDPRSGSSQLSSVFTSNASYIENSIMNLDMDIRKQTSHFEGHEREGNEKNIIFNGGNDNTGSENLVLVNEQTESTVMPNITSNGSEIVVTDSTPARSSHQSPSSYKRTIQSRLDRSHSSTPRSDGSRLSRSKSDRSRTFSLHSNRSCSRSNRSHSNRSRSIVMLRSCDSNRSRERQQSRHSRSPPNRLRSSQSRSIGLIHSSILEKASLTSNSGMKTTSINNAYGRVESNGNGRGSNVYIKSSVQGRGRSSHSRRSHSIRTNSKSSHFRSRSRSQTPRSMVRQKPDNKQQQCQLQTNNRGNLNNWKKTKENQIRRKSKEISTSRSDFHSKISRIDNHLSRSEHRSRRCSPDYSRRRSRSAISSNGSNGYPQQRREVAQSQRQNAPQGSQSIRSTLNQTNSNADLKNVVRKLIETTSKNSQQLNDIDRRLHRMEMTVNKIFVLTCDLNGNGEPMHELINEQGFDVPEFPITSIDELAVIRRKLKDKEFRAFLVNHEKDYSCPTKRSTDTVTISKYLKRFISLRVRAKLTLKENGESGLTLYKDYHQVYLFLIDVMKAGYRSCKKTITNDDAHAALRIVWGRSKQLFNDECQRVK